MKKLFILLGIVFLIPLVSADCYIWSANGQEYCRDEKPDYNQAADNVYSKYEDCTCIQEVPAVVEWSSCSHKMESYIRSQVEDRLFYSLTNHLGDRKLCGVCGEKKTIGHVIVGGVCSGSYDPSDCGRPEGDDGGVCVGDNICLPCLVDPEIGPVQNGCVNNVCNHPPPGSGIPEICQGNTPCCYDQDGDGEGITEYSETQCGAKEIPYVWEGEELIHYGGDCDDSNDDVYRGCEYKVDSVDLHYSWDYFQLLQDEEIELYGPFGFMEPVPLITNSRIDEIGPFSISGEWESENINVAVDGSEMECQIEGSTEKFRWWPGEPENMFNKHKLRIIIQSLDTQPVEKDQDYPEWKDESKITLSLSDERCDLNRADPRETPYEGIEYTCKVKFDIERKLRGKFFRCKAIPFVDRLNEYWEDKSKLNDDFWGVAKFVSVFAPVDTFMETSKKGDAEVDYKDENGQWQYDNRDHFSHGSYVIYDTDLLIQNQYIDEGTKINVLKYLYTYSDTRKGIRWFDKQVIMNDADNSLLPVKWPYWKNPLASEYSMDIEYNSDIEKYILKEITVWIDEHPEAKGKYGLKRNNDKVFGEWINENLKTNYDNSFTYGLWSRGGDVAVYEIKVPTAFDFRPNNLGYPEVKAVVDIFWELPVVIPEIYETRVTESRAAASFVPSGDLIYLTEGRVSSEDYSHEKGHQLEFLCDEYSVHTYNYQYNFKGGCINNWPKCCTSSNPACENSWGDCKGMPHRDPDNIDYINRNFYSIMGHDREGHGLPQIYPVVKRGIFSQLPNRDYCPLRSGFYDSCQYVEF